MHAIQDLAKFFRQRAGAVFDRRRKHAVISAEWLHEVNEARTFIRYHRGILGSEARERAAGKRDEARPCRGEHILQVFDRALPQN